MIIINQNDSPNYFEIKRVTKTRYLGLMLDCKWNFHVPIKYPYVPTNYSL